MKKCFLILLLFMLNASNVFAAKLYQVNVIIFSHITSDALSSENWPNKLLTPDLRGTIDLLDKQTIGNYQLLSENYFGLKNELATLSKQSDYHVLLNVSWTQPMNSPQSVNWIHVYGGQPYDQTGQPTAPSSTNKPAYWEINGKIKVSLQNFYQIYTQLYLTEPTSIIGDHADSNIIGNFQHIPLQSFELYEIQHTKLNELNYLDHPLFGMLIKITPSRE